jgi:neutral ceramidase
MAHDGTLMMSALLSKVVLRLATALSLLASLAVVGCEPERMPLSRYAAFYVPPPNVAGRFFAGAEIADVTPPAGASTFGHGVDAHVAQGYWTRLHCRAFVLVNEVPAGTGINTNAVAIVPCELAAMSALLQRSVAAKLELGTAIPPQRLFISAIHTHAGPAHYFDGSFYGGIASSHVPGFDQRMVDFLATRIAQAIDTAYKRAIAARTENRPAELRWLHGQVWGLTHNRSLAAFRMNGDPRLVAAPPAVDPELDPAALAIDPNLDILEIAEKPKGAGEPLPIGWLSFFGMHPTVLPSSNRYFGSDAFGVACQLAEQELHRLALERGSSGPPPLVGLVNTNEADLAPRWSTGNVEETITIGKRLADHMLRIWKEDDSKAASARVKFEDSPRIAATYLEVKLPGNSFGLDPGQKLCDHAELGLSAIWGASDHQSMLIDARDVSAPAVDLNRLLHHDCQAPKREALGFLQTAMGGGGAFPSEVPLGLVQIDDTSVAFVPAEVSSTVGARIKQRVIAASPPVKGGRERHAVVGGLTNGYCEYVATPEEYQLQLYEGGSTLYGQYTAPFLAASFENMAQRLARSDTPPPPGTKADVAYAYPYETGPARHRLADSAEDRVKPVALGICQSPRTSDITGPPRFCFSWLDSAPNVVSSPPYRPVALAAVDARAHASLVHLTMQYPLTNVDANLKLEAGDEILSDSGFDFRTAVHGRSGDEYVWTTLFDPTPEEWANLLAQPTRFEFRVGDAIHQPELDSPPFYLTSETPTLAICSPATARFCGMAE